MSSSSRSKVSSVLSLVAAMSMLLTGLAFGVKHADAASFSTSSAAATKDKISVVKTVDPRKLPTGKVPEAAKPKVTIPYHAPPKQNINRGLKMPHVRGSSSTIRPNLGGMLQNFNGVSAFDNFNVNGFQVEPPDQGLCVGNGFVMELVNLAGAIYHSDGSAAVGPFNLQGFFGEPSGVFGTFISDPRCYYDPSTNTWFATVLGVTSGSRIDLAVNASGDPTMTWTIYQIDTTDLSHPGCPCLPDQPLLGIDQFNLYISTNEFSFFAPIFNGAQVYAISKSQLVSLSHHVNIVHFDKLTFADNPVASLQPAITVGKADAEYLANSIFYDNLDNRLGVWAITNQQAVTAGGTPTISDVLITSEVYVQPSVAPNPNRNTLNPDDTRLQQLVFSNGNLWTALDTALIINGDTQSRDGAAWFDIQPVLSGDGTTIQDAKIANQGYVAVSGNYVLYPAIAINSAGTVTMALSVTGLQTFPSAAFSVLAAGDTSFGAVQLAAPGATTDNGFTCGGLLAPCRWGDYSAAMLDPTGGKDFWLATEYIPPVGSSSANWGTRVYEVQGS
jgi:hypothetical protein